MKSLKSVLKATVRCARGSRVQLDVGFVAPLLDRRRWAPPQIFSCASMWRFRAMKKLVAFHAGVPKKPRTLAGRVVPRIPVSVCAVYSLTMRQTARRTMPGSDVHNSHG